jgi:hypothetical protein
MLSSASFTEECIEGVISTANSFVARHLAIRLDSVFQTVKFPTRVAHLDSGLADMN